MAPAFSTAENPTPVHLIEKSENLALPELSPAQGAFVAASGFKGNLGQCLALPDAEGEIALVLFGWGDEKARLRTRHPLASAAETLPPGHYALATDLPAPEASANALGWLLAQYRFSRYRANGTAQANLAAPAGVDRQRIEAIAAAEYLTRDLINTPSNDMGPAELESAARSLSDEFGATITVIEADALLQQNFPLIHAVGRASVRAPRLIDLRWGGKGPTVTLVGKGICFDTGGLNLKPGSSMGLMKKDMGGAANALGLARMIMSLGLKVRLRVLIPAAENSVSGSSFRPGDILTSRKGLTVEINNTDAEGRLVLADALAYGDEEAPDLMFCMATLTGAARVALGPDVPPFYTNDGAVAHELARASTAEADPIWRMPFHEPYEEMIEPGIADLDNAPSGGFAGSITAALFLRRFVETAGAFAHFDLFGWQPKPAPGRPKGGAAQGIRAMLRVIEGRLG